MSNPPRNEFPDVLKFETDLAGLVRYRRVVAFLCWFSVFGFFGLAIGIVWAENRIEEMDVSRTWQLFLSPVVGGFCGLAGAAVAALVFYILFHHKKIAKYSATQRLEVDGGFLRVVNAGFFEESDHKIHFRSLIDFILVDSRWLRFSGIRRLLITTAGGGPGTTIHIDGIKDAEIVRDTLAEIDRLREDW